MNAKEFLTAAKASGVQPLRVERATLATGTIVELKHDRSFAAPVIMTTWQSILENYDFPKGPHRYYFDRAQCVAAGIWK